MLGLKPIGIFASLFGIVYGLILAGAIKLDPPMFDVHSLASPGLAGGLSFLVGLVMLMAWLWYFTQNQVRVIGTAYAERLFEKLPAQKKLPSSGKAPATRAAQAVSPNPQPSK